MENIHQSATRMRLSHRAADFRDAKKLGVALGPGLPIGLVDLGMLIALEQLKIKVSMISGTSMGSVMGAFYASGLAPEEIREEVIKIFADGTVSSLLQEDMRFPRLGLSTADKLMAKLIEVNGWDPEFHELRVPFFVLASDRSTSRSVVIRHGRVWEAVRASTAMPFLLTRQKIGGMDLADGAILAQLDTDVLYAEGADFVIAIQAKPIKSELKRTLPVSSKLQPYLLKMMGWKTDPEIFFDKPKCDILLRPRVPQSLATDGKRVDEIIQLGVKITYEAMTEIEEGNFSQNRAGLSDSKLDAGRPGTTKDLEDEALQIEEFLEKLEQESKNLSDAGLMKEFPRFADRMNSFLAELTTANPGPRAAGEALRAKATSLARYVNDSPFVSRCLEKPRGYAGDYQMMNYMYDNDILAARSNMGKFLNYLMFTNPMTKTVRNRSKIIQGLIQQRVAVQPELTVTSIACGPAREVGETIKLISEREDSVRIAWTLLDQDQEALQYAKSHLPESQALDPKLVNGGVRELLKQQVTLDPQDIIYSLGLFDYLDEKVSVMLIKCLYAYLKPGGLLLIGNYAPNHPDHAFMEGVMEWYLIFRTEKELLKLGQTAAPEARHFVMAEPEGLNLILVTSKPLESQT